MTTLLRYRVAVIQDGQLLREFRGQDSTGIDPADVAYPVAQAHAGAIVKVVDLDTRRFTAWVAFGDCARSLTHAELTSLWAL